MPATEAKRIDDKFLRGLVVSSFISAVIGVTGWIYTLVVIQTDVNYLKVEQRRTAELYSLVIELKTVIKELTPVIHSTNKLMRDFGTEQATRTSTIKRSNKHIDDTRIHQYRYGK